MVKIEKELTITLSDEDAARLIRLAGKAVVKNGGIVLSMEYASYQDAIEAREWLIKIYEEARK